MTRLFNHIEYLLHNHDCVVLPGFGGFVQNEVNSRIKEDTIYPPMKEISFNERLIFNDGILVQSYQEALHKSYEEALSELKKDIFDFQNLLSSQGVVPFGRIGRFELKEKIEFYPSSENLFNPNFFGLESLSLEKIIHNKDLVEVKNPYLYIKLKKASFENWLTLVAACLFLFFMVQPIENVDNSLQEAFIAEKYLIGDLNTVNEDNITASLSNVETSLADSVVYNIDTTHNIDKTLNNVNSKEVNTEKDSKEYYIVLGSFAKLSSAVSHIHNFKDNKYFKNAKIIDYGNRYRVYSYSSSKKIDVIKELEIVRNSSKKLSNAWIFSNKTK